MNIDMKESWGESYFYFLLVLFKATNKILRTNAMKCFLQL